MLLCTVVGFSHCAVMGLPGEMVEGCGQVGHRCYATTFTGQKLRRNLGERASFGPSHKQQQVVRVGVRGHAPYELRLKTNARVESEHPQLFANVAV